MNKSLNDYIAAYKEKLEQGDIRIAYEALRKYMPTLKTHFSKELSDKYSFGNVFPGFMDYTYFYFSDAYLRERKLRFGVVLNHREMRFELWLMGYNVEVQAKYWERLKDTKWNKDRRIKPRYSELEAIIVSNPNFDNLKELTKHIERETVVLTTEIVDYLKDNEAIK